MAKLSPLFEFRTTIFGLLDAAVAIPVLSYFPDSQPDLFVYLGAISIGDSLSKVGCYGWTADFEVQIVGRYKGTTGTYQDIDGIMNTVIGILSEDHESTNFVFGVSALSVNQLPERLADSSAFRNIVSLNFSISQKVD